MSRLVDYMGRCYKSDEDGWQAYLQVSGIVMRGKDPAELPLEITHILCDDGGVTFRRRRIAPEDLRSEHIKTEEITPAEYLREVREILDAYEPAEIPDEQGKRAIIDLLRKGVA